MYLQELQRNWETFGQEDPLWAVASQPDKVDNAWDVKEFFATGRNYISRIAAWMESHDHPVQRKTALDFGCGVGRLTQALCDHFATCVGVDIAPSMIAKAKEYNQFGLRCAYRLNERDDLSLFPSQTFDMVHSAHVLQHIRPNVSLNYIAEFIRLLKPGGLAVFHCPSSKATYAYPEEGVTCSLSTDIPATAMGQGTKLTLPIRVTNTCNHSIGMNKQTNAPVRLIHSWYNLDTEELLQSHGRLNLLKTILEPGQTLEMDYKAASPPEAGNYLLLLVPHDYLGHPLASSDRSQLAVPVLVTEAPRPEADTRPLAKQRPYSETHAIPVEAVEQAVRQAGGRMLDVQSTQQILCGQVSSIYYATR